MNASPPANTVPLSTTALQSQAAPASAVPPHPAAHAANVAVQTGAAHPTQVAMAATPLNAAPHHAAAPMSPAVRASLRLDKEFDAEASQGTRIHFTALSDYEDQAARHFFGQRQMVEKQGGNPYADFRTERHAAMANRHSSPIDVSETKSYKALSANRQNISVSLDDRFDGKSPLEYWLPKDSKFRSVLEPGLGSIRDIQSGLNAQLVRRDGKPAGSPDRYILTFPGTGVVDTAGAQWKTNVRQFLGIGGVPPMYRQAVELAKEIQQRLPPGCELELCGHSLGGGIASFVGLSLNLNTVGFNSAPLGPACIKALGKANALTRERLDKLRQIRTEGDPVTSRGVNKTLARLAHGAIRFGARVPQLAGTVYKISRHSDFNTPGSALERHTTKGFQRAYPAAATAAAHKASP